MAQPTAFARSADYSEDAANSLGGRSTIEPTKLDAEIDAIALTISEIRTVIALNQRDDGEIRDGRVKIHTLASDVRSLLATSGVTVRGDWVTATAYAVKDIVSETGATYICATAHTSGTFATDLAADKWVLLMFAPSALAASGVSVTPAGSISATTVQAALEELGTEKLAAASNLSDVASAATALANLAGTPLAGGTMTGLLTLSGTPTSALHAATKAYADANVAGLAIGQCRLDYVGTTQIKLSPHDGNKLFINGAFETVPSAGVTLSNASLSASTFYYIYAYMASGTMTLEASTTARATDTTYGHQIKTGDATRTLVGAVYMTSGTVFADSISQRFVLSWFNRKWKRGRAVWSTSGSTTSTSLVEVRTDGRVEFISWSDDAVWVGAIGPHFNSAAGFSYMTAAVYIGSTSTHTAVDVLNYVTGTAYSVISQSVWYTLTEGYRNYVSALNAASAATTCTIGGMTNLLGLRG